MEIIHLRIVKDFMSTKCAILHQELVKLLSVFLEFHIFSQNLTLNNSEEEKIINQQNFQPSKILLFLMINV